ncbi:MAG TPA: ATP-binding protein [Bryobacteraceae bacterium]|nr:ATP-binding protein [Bryobacteraceae bacterium]
MKRRLTAGLELLLFLVLLTLVVWQGSFLTPLAPSSLEQTFVFWGLSTIVFLLTVMLGFMLFRTGVKLYIERRKNRLGSHIRTKFVLGALALSMLPVFFLVLFSVQVLNRNLDKWFSRPAEGIRGNLLDVGAALDKEMHERLEAEANWMASLPRRPEVYSNFCRTQGVLRAVVDRTGIGPETVCGPERVPSGEDIRTATIPVAGGAITLSERLPLDLAKHQVDTARYIAQYDRLAREKRSAWRFYILLLLLITLFILFFATWVALFLARQISEPLSALLRAVEEVRGGNLAYRLEVGAIDELAAVVKAFNDMTYALDASRRELEERRRFTEAILESIPTGVISLAADGHILLTNRALRGIFSDEQVNTASRVEDLLSAEDAAEVRYLMKRARRTGVAASQLDHRAAGGILHLSATVAALEGSRRSGFVLVLEDTSDLLRAQKAVAWQEVARRVAHEIKNPLTPIALCADRIGRQLKRNAPPEDTRRVLAECSGTILREVETVRTLIDEFSQFSRFPTAKPAPTDLNEVVENALAVCETRLDGTRVDKRLAAELPLVNVDPEQFKRVVVNLLDNAADAMQGGDIRRLEIGTAVTEADSVRLTIADTGCGISAEDKEKLFLPYFSTKGRGTGLGLAIVNRIITDHDAAIRVEDNHPRGARFIVDIPLPARIEHEVRPVESKA